MVIGAGDFASVHKGLEEAIDALSAIAEPTVLVPGNNETEDALRAACEGWGAATVLHGEGTKIDGVQFFGLGAGVPVTPWDWSFDLDEEAAAAKLAGCPAGAVLVVHSPPNGHCDAAAPASTSAARRPRGDRAETAAAGGLRSYPRVVGRRKRDRLDPGLQPRPDAGTAIEFGS